MFYLQHFIVPKHKIIPNTISLLLIFEMGEKKHYYLPITNDYTFDCLHYTTYAPNTPPMKKLLEREREKKNVEIKKKLKI